MVPMVPLSFSRVTLPRSCGRSPDCASRGAGSGPAPRPAPPWSLLDRGTDQVAVLGPAAAIVARLLQAEQVAQDEPRVAGALADAAVGDRRPARIDALLLQVKRPQLVRRLERPVRGDGGAPGHAPGPRDVPATL